MVSIPASEKLYSRGSQRQVSMNPSTSQSNLKCYLFNGNQKLEVCDKFKRRNGEEQFKFVRSKKLCDNGLSPFHFAAGCKQSKSCSISGCDLKWKHLTSLHEPVFCTKDLKGEIEMGTTLMFVIQTVMEIQKHQMDLLDWQEEIPRLGPDVE